MRVSPCTLALGAILSIATAANHSLGADQTNDTAPLPRHTELTAKLPDLNLKDKSVQRVQARATVYLWKDRRGIEYHVLATEPTEAYFAIEHTDGVPLLVNNGRTTCIYDFKRRKMLTIKGFRPAIDFSAAQFVDSKSPGVSFFWGWDTRPAAAVKNEGAQPAPIRIDMPSIFAMLPDNRRVEQFGATKWKLIAWHDQSYQAVATFLRADPVQLERVEVFSSKGAAEIGFVIDLVRGNDAVIAKVPPAATDKQLQDQFEVIEIGLSKDPADLARQIEALQSRLYQSAAAFEAIVRPASRADAAEGLGDMDWKDSEAHLKQIVPVLQRLFPRPSFVESKQQKKP